MFATDEDEKSRKIRALREPPPAPAQSRAEGAPGEKSMTGRDSIIGSRLFTDGSCRDVFLGPDGRQYVLGDDGEAVPGIWLVPGHEQADRPLFLDAPACEP
jgi:hypothetical protein